MVYTLQKVRNDFGVAIAVKKKKEKEEKCMGKNICEAKHCQTVYTIQTLKYRNSVLKDINNALREDRETLIQTIRCLTKTLVTKE